MTRGHRAVTALAIAALTLAGCTTAKPAHKPDSGPQSSRPNIVFVLTDDLASNLVQYMPNVQALQKAGTTMASHYVVDSLCCPSRAAIFTGEYPHDDGVFTNDGGDGGFDTFNDHGNQANSFAVALHKAGYRTGFMGKYLNGYQPANEPQPGWDEWDVAGNGYPEFDYSLNENGKQKHYGKAPSAYLTDVISSKAASFVDSADVAGKPFMLELATFAPHAPYVPAPRDSDTFPGLTAPHSASYGKQPSDAPAWLKAIPALGPKDTQRIDRDFRRRAQSVQAVDDMIGRLMRQLRDKGMGKNTYVVFSSDNGYHMGEHRLRPGKQTAFDTDINVPLIVTGPGVPAGRTVSQLTSSIDLAPTLEEVGGAGIPSTVDGISLLSLLHGKTVSPWQEAVLVEHHGPVTGKSDPDKPGGGSGNPPSYEAIRTATALYVEYLDGEREYYNTTSDPEELHNLFATAAKSQMAPLQQALSALEQCHNAAACQVAAHVG